MSGLAPHVTVSRGRGAGFKYSPPGFIEGWSPAIVPTPPPVSPEPVMEVTWDTAVVSSHLAPVISGPSCPRAVHSLRNVRGGRGSVLFTLQRAPVPPLPSPCTHLFTIVGLFWTQTKSGKKNTKSEAMTLPLLASFPAVLSSPEAVLNLQPKGGNTYVAVNHCHKRRFLCRGGFLFHLPFFNSNLR